MRLPDNVWLIQGPFQIGVFILDKLINDIKAKLPMKKKAEDDELDDNDGEGLGSDATDPTVNLSDRTSSTDIRDLDEDEADEEPKSLVDKIKAKFAPKNKASAKDDDEDNDEVDSKKKKSKKKINPVVLIVVLGGLGFFLFYEDEPSTETAVVGTKPISKIKKTPKEDRPVVDETAPATNTDAAVVNPDDISVPPVTIDSNTEDNLDPVSSTRAEEPITSGDVATDQILTDPEDPIDTSVIEEPVITDTPIIPDPMLGPESVDSVDGQIAVDESSMTDKILEDLEKQVKKDEPKEVKKEYVAPPDYEYKGRGLVYNCAGKHWACVDAPSYKSCEDNFSSVTFKKKTIECYPFNVYESTKGCEAMQNRVVSSNAKTGFCK